MKTLLLLLVTWFFVAESAYGFFERDTVPENLQNTPLENTAFDVRDNLGPHQYVGLVHGACVSHYVRSKCCLTLSTVDQLAMFQSVKKEFDTDGSCDAPAKCNLRKLDDFHALNKAFLFPTLQTKTEIYLETLRLRL